MDFNNQLHNCEVLEELFDSCDDAGEAGLKFYRQMRRELTRHKRRKQKDTTSMEARFTIAIQACGHSVITLAKYADDDSFEPVTIEEINQAFFGILRGCFNYVFAKHRAAINGLWDRVKSFTPN